MSLIVREFTEAYLMHFRNTGNDASNATIINFPMPAHLKSIKSTIAHADRPIGRSEKCLEDWQKIADEQTAKAFELYIARLKQNPAVASVADV
jgi:hypothetical protein